MTDDVALGPYGCESTSFLSVDGERRKKQFSFSSEKASPGVYSHARRAVRLYCSPSWFSLSQGECFPVKSK